MVANVDQRGRLIGREIGGRPELDFHRVDQRTGDTAACSVGRTAAVSREHRAQDVVGPRAADHVRDERVPGDQSNVVRHLQQNHCRHTAIIDMPSLSSLYGWHFNSV